MKEKVLIMRCNEYDPKKIAGIVKKGMEELNVHPTGNVLLKPNAVLAHPEVFPNAFTRSEFLDGDEVTFVADPNGGTPSFSYDWSSDIDGDIGSGSPLAVSTLTVGEHMITVMAEDGESRFDDNSITVTILPAPPDIDEISDGLAAYGSEYTGPTPVLLKGTVPITWSLVEGPAGMTIDVAWRTTDH